MSPEIISVIVLTSLFGIAVSVFQASSHANTAEYEKDKSTNTKKEALEHKKKAMSKLTPNYNQRMNLDDWTYLDTWINGGSRRRHKKLKQGIRKHEQNTKKNEKM